MTQKSSEKTKHDYVSFQVWLDLVLYYILPVCNVLTSTSSAKRFSEAYNYNHADAAKFQSEVMLQVCMSIKGLQLKHLVFDKDNNKLT